MEDKHIYSTSFWSKFQDKLRDSVKVIQKTIQDMKPKQKSTNVPTTVTKVKIPETPVVTKTTPPKAVASEKPKTNIEKSKTERPKKEKIKHIHVRRMADESVQRTLVLTLGIAIIGIVGVGIFSSYIINTNPKTNQNTSKSKAQISPTPISKALIWKTYTNKIMGIEFKYPDKLTLSEKNNLITLNHSIPYENNGSCDIEGSDRHYDKFNDFNLTFEVKSSKIPDYTDGEYRAGTLSGVWQYEGVEGCGNDIYFFPLSDDKTLIVKRERVQAFSGISTSWNLKLDEILNVPGVINKEESDKLFNQILSTFKFIE